jgi:Domain of unknown function (DUF4381)
MQDFDQILFSQLRDIHGPVMASWWPLAAGWWLVLFVLISVSFILVKKIIRVRQYRKTWKYRIELELEKIAKDQSAENAKENISRINEILKRIAIKLYGRKESAGLAGKKWLVWLTNRDPSNFNWLKKAQILVDFPYMPEEKIMADNEQILAIAKATKQWLRL